MSKNFSASNQNAYGLWFVVVFISIFVLSCAPSQTQPASEQAITAYSTSSAQPWMNDLFTCANDLSVKVQVSADQPDIFLRIGEPDVLLSSAYQIGEEEIFIVTHRQSPLQNLSLEEAQALFAGEGGIPVQVWVYPSELDLQRVFDQFVMQGRGVTSSARVAVNPQQMSDVLNSESDAVGILPARWKVGNVREVYSLGGQPVLALLREGAPSAAGAVIACLQGN